MKLEVFEDRMYYDQWCVRPEGSKEFCDTIHFVRKVDALVAQKIIEKWIAQEREACAQIVEHYNRAWNDQGYALAQAIRARGNK
jgi:hypothetical protein